MMRLPLLSLIALISLASCASERQSIHTSVDHPASSHAQAGAMPMTHNTLALSDPIGPATPPLKMEHGEHTDHDHAPATTPDDAAPDSHAGHAHSEANPSRGKPIYVCPMHPEVTSTLPDQKCPKCGMKLKLKEDVKAKT